MLLADLWGTGDFSAVFVSVFVSCIPYHDGPVVDVIKPCKIISAIVVNSIFRVEGFRIAASVDGKGFDPLVGENLFLDPNAERANLIHLSGAEDRKAKRHLALAFSPQTHDITGKEFTGVCGRKAGKGGGYHKGDGEKERSGFFHV